MKENKDIVDRRLETYKRNHSGSNFYENEVSKIKREKTYVIKVKKQSASLPLDTSDEATEMYFEKMNQAKKAAGNANTHKKRLKSLSQSDDFQ